MIEKQKKKTKFRKCPKCHQETIMMVCCGKFLEEKKYETNKQTSKEGVDEG